MTRSVTGFASGAEPEKRPAGAAVPSKVRSPLRELPQTQKEDPSLNPEERTESSIAFGPVPSRRLGRSIGVNNIPPKTCSYSCIYCQLGRTTRSLKERRAFYPPRKILDAVRTRATASSAAGESVDFVTFVASGEPTLDVNLGTSIDLLKPLGIDVAVISNASMMGNARAREDLAKADWVSLKVDAADEGTWRAVNRPTKGLRFREICEGICEFARGYDGVLTTETMLIKGMNEDESSLNRIASLVRQLDPATAYISIPIRPPAEADVCLPAEKTLGTAYCVFREAVEYVELLIGSEGDRFGATGDAAKDLLSITSVHPMRAEAVREFLKRAGLTWSVVDALVAERRLVELKHGEETFYVRGITASSDVRVRSAGEDEPHT
jgi:wyosine [tRNA(Phe)-imidazoG37] synthetase (radical SAM superfamily)